MKLENQAKLGIRVAMKNMKSAPLATLKTEKRPFPAAGDENGELQKSAVAPDRRKSFVYVAAELQELLRVAKRSSCNPAERLESLWSKVCRQAIAIGARPAAER